MTATLNYVPVGCNNEIQVPVRIVFPSISFTGTAGQTPTVAPVAGVPQLINTVINNNCVNVVSVAVPVTFTATYPA